jgi:hypothetical protein
VLQCHFGGVLLGVIDVLPVIPISSRNVLALDGHGAGPRGPPAFTPISQGTSYATEKISRAYRAYLRRSERPEGESALRGMLLVAVS